MSGEGQHYPLIGALISIGRKPGYTVTKHSSKSPYLEDSKMRTGDRQNFGVMCKEGAWIACQTWSKYWVFRAGTGSSEKLLEVYWEIHLKL